MAERHFLYLIDFIGQQYFKIKIALKREYLKAQQEYNGRFIRVTKNPSSLEN
jgi:hypothetical protein